MEQRTLILVRHADARPGGPRDELRELTPSGAMRALELGRMLAPVSGAVDLALVSPALRARRTFEGIARSLSVSQSLTHSALYLEGAHSLLADARALDAGTLLVVGHEPTISQAGLLLGDEEAKALLARGMPTAGALVIRYPSALEALEGAGLGVEMLVAPRFE
ncbi:MAG: histidine phosphatase family protein [Schaalia hyovaginalis]|uniref:SixA phosphatase family protein n=1 Tax=Schaalia TaxID=2529408 RepID=UPI0026EF0822|nr:histidine phosphatase family protein [Schaalia hyovaginalis]MCI6412098.1 histidine phosphatase family protein [Schaalia hyovaginalis]MCI6556096.1 histidine phosphatase family protein [Schaalia hyovaginalis]MCI7512397.1 histidine phosphatase family protein [Schaalia hyovaginalis]MDD7553712.1 histidine phosphatase family protein [Schaalia hyovaginalis]MDY3092965.1 histidine phosphatase family protein [Schaalia hyovaginalis]